MIMVINLDTRIDTWQGFGLVQFLIPAPTPPFLFSLAKFRQKAKLKIKKSKKKWFWIFSFVTSKGKKQIWPDFYFISSL